MIWLIGAGGMAQDYAKVLQELGRPFVVVGRGGASAEKFAIATGVVAVPGGLEAFLATRPARPEAAIVAVSVEQVANTTAALLRYGVPRVLAEKPLALYLEDLEEIANLAGRSGIRLAVAYNRRFFVSVAKARELIAADGGVRSFHFEFTEWAHKIAPLTKGPGVKERWALANSSHVMDLAFHLGGWPEQLEYRRAGALPWHPAGANFAGCGATANNVLFTYQANWDAPGRWGVELLTDRHRLILRPLETLQVQERGSVAINPVDCHDPAEERHKPGLLRQVEAFLGDGTSLLATLEEYRRLFNICCRIAGYQESR